MKTCLNCGKKYVNKRKGFWLSYFDKKIKDIDLCSIKCLKAWKIDNPKVVKKIDKLTNTNIIKCKKCGKKLNVMPISIKRYKIKNILCSCGYKNSC